MCGTELDFDRITDLEYANIDHILSKAHGGTNSRSNLSLSHTICNDRKGCGCYGPHDDRKFRRELYFAQNFRCIVYGDLVVPSEVYRPELVRVVNGELGHTACFYRWGVETGQTRNLVKPEGS